MEKKANMMNRWIGSVAMQIKIVIVSNPKSFTKNLHLQN